MNLTIEACRIYPSILAKRWEFFAQPKSSPVYDAYHDRKPFAFVVRRDNAGRFSEAIIEVPYLALYWVDHSM